jgi:hypothetical protein
MISRPNVHFADRPIPDSGYLHESSTKLTVPSSAYDSANWQGLNYLLGDVNGWISDMVRKPGGGTSVNSSTQIPHWSQLMALYREQPSPALLTQIESEADIWIEQQVATPKENDVGDTFYNGPFYPYWWDLPDLYELTHERRYLDAARIGAFGTIAGLWAEPAPPNTDVPVNDDGEFNCVTWILSKGDRKYRLGFPRRPGDTPVRTQPAWLVADVGLGLEGLGTYVDGGGDGIKYEHILTSAWAPNLMRMYELTGDDIYRIYARNSIISRFANYPGYYHCGYTDVQLSADYPYKGPDVGSIYYHHIPVQLGFSLDFLVEEARSRSHGKIAFPWTKQQGYVWFTYRVYGQQAGTVFGDDAGLWLDRKLAHVDSPALNYLTARSKNRFWMILMNEADSPQSAAVYVDAAALRIDLTKPYQVVEDSGQVLAKDATSTPIVTVPAKGLIAIAFAAESVDSTPPPPKLTRAHVTEPAGASWGDVHAYRIRAPFGKDALYVILTGRPAAGAAATLNMRGAPPQTVRQYPYEFTVYPWPMDKNIRFTLTLADVNTTARRTSPLSLPGTSQPTSR